jgi:nucleoside 2-deoxyribosyltransferase
MTGFTVVGGVYLERCIQPLWNAIFGSAGRAMQAVAPHVPAPVRLVTYVDEQSRPAVQSMVQMSGGMLEAYPCARTLSFDYLHPLATPTITPPVGQIVQANPIRVVGDVVLRYGMLEGEAIVDAKVAIYDPQSAFGAVRFGENGSKAKRLAVVLNQAEAIAMTGLENPTDAAHQLLAEEGTEVVVLKRGASGVLVMTGEGRTQVPLYRTERVWKVGSGDVFSSTFAALWGVNDMDPVEAADCASRATAYYCQTRSLPVPTADALKALPYTPVQPGAGKVYLASPFFDIGQRWVVEEARALLLDMGAAVFSPVHEVGPGPAEIVAPEDLAGLDGCDVVFAVLNGLDPGTIFEVGYAVKRGMPVVALAQNEKEEDLKMLKGSGCEVVDDFASALYRTIWRLPVP